MRAPSSVSVLGTPLRATNYAELTDDLQSRSRAPGSFSVDFTNTQIVTMRRCEPPFREITSRVDYFIPDGMPLIWCLNRAGAGLNDRVYGPTFTRHCIINSPAPFKHYFLGGSETCLAKLSEVFLKQNPDIQIVGSHHGYFEPADEPHIVDEINRLSPDFVWVGLGTPKQQDWIHRNKSRLQRGIVLAVGFAFDVNAGTKPDPPPWMQRAGLGWLFRLGSEPGRLLGRYLKYNSLFLYYLLCDGLRGKAICAETDVRTRQDINRSSP